MADVNLLLNNRDVRKVREVGAKGVCAEHLQLT